MVCRVGRHAPFRTKGYHPPHLYWTLTSYITQRYNNFNENIKVFGNQNLLHHYFKILVVNKDNIL